MEKKKDHVNIYLVLIANLKTGLVMQTEIVGDLLRHIKENKQEEFQVISQTFLRHERNVFYG